MWHSCKESEKSSSVTLTSWTYHIFPIHSETFLFCMEMHIIVNLQGLSRYKANCFFSSMPINESRYHTADCCYFATWVKPLLYVFCVFFSTDSFEFGVLCRLLVVCCVDCLLTVWVGNSFVHVLYTPWLLLLFNPSIDNSLHLVVIVCAYLCGVKSA